MTSLLRTNERNNRYRVRNFNILLTTILIKHQYLNTDFDFINYSNKVNVVQKIIYYKLSRWWFYFPKLNYVESFFRSQIKLKSSNRSDAIMWRDYPNNRALYFSTIFVVQKLIWGILELTALLSIIFDYSIPKLTIYFLCFRSVKHTGFNASSQRSCYQRNKP